jgi:4-alpha-glucanotransferase
MDSYPYAAISAFALHPMYINLEKATDLVNQYLLKRLDDKKAILNAKNAVDYEEVLKEKITFLKKIFPLQSKTTFAKTEYKQYFNNNQHWLVPYAVFCYLRDEYGTAHFNEWPAYRHYNEKELAELTNEKSDAYNDISFHYFVQYHLHLQLLEATEYAHSKGIVVKGDIAIGIYRNGADAWQHSNLYNMNLQAGAPPDDFAVKGQNWGFPTYNWQKMKEDGFAWWKQRFEQMSYYFDAFRIDHILGFFRIWSIPMHAVEGIMGHFVPAIPVHINEIFSRGIDFNHHRFTKPFITDHILWEEFENDNEYVKNVFLDYDGFGKYKLKDGFTTQREVEKHFDTLDQNDFHNKLKLGLYNLISNVILFDVESANGQEFHFRFAMEGTSSFQNLDHNSQHQLKELYVDYFFRRQDNFWMKEAMQKLPALRRVTNMLICGEDLGLVPDCVPDVMKQLGLLSLEIQRMPKDNTKEFFHPNDAPYLSVVTPSTHDMSTIRGWWEEDKSKIQKFFNNELGQWGEAPFFCEAWVNKAVVVQNLYSPAMWAIFQLQDLLGMDESLRRENPNDERINVPANPKHYWQYRMNLTLEDLQNANDFNNSLRDSIKMSGR